MTAFDMDAFSSFEASLNSQYNSTITTEWPFTGLGILDMVSWLGLKAYLQRTLKYGNKFCRVNLQR